MIDQLIDQLLKEGTYFKIVQQKESIQSQNLVNMKTSKIEKLILFDEIKRKSDEYFAERERLLNMRQTNKKERECEPIELLPTEMYGKIFLYLT